jgi:hypothetical protein
MRKFPELHLHQYAVLIADGATGNVLTTSGVVSISEKDLVYMIFDTISDAESYVHAMQSTHETWELVLYDHQQTMISYFSSKRFSNSK